MIDRISTYYYESHVRSNINCAKYNWSNSRIDLMGKDDLPCTVIGPLANFIADKEREEFTTSLII
jgi:hypothetical protein